MRRWTRLLVTALSVCIGLVVMLTVGCRFDTSGIPPDPTPQFTELEGCYQGTEGFTPRVVRTLRLSNPERSLLNGFWCQVKEDIPGVGSQAIITSIEGRVTESTVTEATAELTATVLPGSVSEVGEQFDLKIRALLSADTITVEGFLSTLSRLSVPVLCPCPPRPPLEVVQ